MKSPRSGTGVSRRDLLRLRPATSRAESGNLDNADRAGIGAPSTQGAGDLIRASRPAMGSYFEIRLGAQVPGAVDLANRALNLIDVLELQMSVYRDDSEISRLNASAHANPVAVEPRLFELLTRAVAISRETGGAYDVTSGALSRAWGFLGGPKRVPDPEALAEARACTGWEKLRLDPESRAIAFDRPGVMINLGSIGKGFAIDRAVDVVRKHWWPTTALVHGGQSSLYALGSPPGRFGDRWEIALRNPFTPESPLGVLRLRNRGLGTSGSAFQRFTIDGRTYGHLLDPRTGEPADGPASVTVLAPTAAEADALSTAFFLLGADWAEAYVRDHPETGAIFVEEGEADASPRVRPVGLSQHDFVSE